mgnify:CR=1 FL=1
MGSNFLISHLLIYIFVRLRLSVSASIHVSVSKGRVPVYLRSGVAGSLAIPILACSLVRDPGGPASFPHAVAYNPDNVQTEMTGYNGNRTPEEGAKYILRATLIAAKDCPLGQYFNEDKIDEF